MADSENNAPNLEAIINKLLSLQGEIESWKKGKKTPKIVVHIIDSQSNT